MVALQSAIYPAMNVSAAIAALEDLRKTCASYSAFQAAAEATLLEVLQKSPLKAAWIDPVNATPLWLAGNRLTKSGVVKSGSIANTFVLVEKNRDSSDEAPPSDWVRASFRAVSRPDGRIGVRDK